MHTVPMSIGGRDHAPASDEWFRSDDPFTGKPWARVAGGSSEDVAVAVKAASRALRSGPPANLTATQRRALVHRLGDVIAANAERLAELEVRDNGKLYAVPLEYSVEPLTCAFASRLDVVLVSLPDAAQDRLRAHVPGTRPGRAGVPRRYGEGC